MRMASKNLDLALRVRADLKNAIAQLDQLEKELDGTDKSARKASKGLDSMSANAGKLKNILAGAVATVLFREIVQAADNFQLLNARLRLVTDSVEEAEKTYADLLDVSQRTRSELNGTVELYARLARSTKELNLSQRELVSLTEAINQSYKVSGATNQEAAASAVQLAQGLQAGALRGDEFNSVAEQAPRLLQALADETGKTTGELRKLGGEGKITAELVARSLLNQADTIEREFEQLPVTVGDALTQLRNTALDSFGRTDTSGLVDAINEIEELVSDPVFRDNIVTLGTAIADAFRVAAKTLSNIVGLAEQLGVSVGQALNSSSDELRKWQDSLEFLERAKDNVLLRTAVSGTATGFELYLNDEEVEAEISRTKARIDELLAEQGFATQYSGNSAKSAKPIEAETKVKTSVSFDDADVKLSAIDKRIAALDLEADALGKNRKETELLRLTQQGATDIELLYAEAALGKIEVWEQSQLAAKQLADDLTDLAGIETQLLNAQGQTSAARGAELESEFSELMQRLVERGDIAGQEIVNKLINIEKAQAQLDELNDEVGRVLSEQSRQEQTIQSDLQAGLISELAARRELLQLHQATAEQVESLLPAMTSLAEETGNPAAIERVKELHSQMQLLKQTSNDFTTTLRDSFESGLADGIQKLATGAQDLRETVEAVVLSISNALLDLASQQLAEMAADQLAGLFSKGAETAIDVGTDAAGAATTAAAISTASATGAAVMGTSITASTAGGAGVMGTSITTAGVVAGQTMAASIIAASAATAPIPGFADGGYTGSGAKYDVAGLVHAGEYVQPAHVLRQPGALQFMESFRSEGMRALNRFKGYADGGFVGRSSFSDSPAATIGASIPPAVIKQRLLPILDSDIIAEALKGSVGEELIELHISRNPSKFRGLIG